MILAVAVLRAAFTHRQRLRGCWRGDSSPVSSPDTTAPPFTPSGNTSSFTCTPGERGIMKARGGCEDNDFGDENVDDGGDGGDSAGVDGNDDNGRVCDDIMPAKMATVTVMLMMKMKRGSDQENTEDW